MPTYATIRLEIEGTIARLTLDRPQKLNSFSPEMTRELRDAAEYLAGRRDLRALVLTGEGRAFCAGQDLEQRRSVADGGEVDLEATLQEGLNGIVRAFRAMPFPTLSVVRGVAAGAGVSLALATDLTIAAEDARFILSFSNIGLGPDAGLSWVLPRLVGRARALGAMMLGTGWSGREAVEIGLIFEAVAPGQLDAVASDLAERLSTRPTLALVSARSLVDAGASAAFDPHLDTEAVAQRACGNTEDYRRGLRAFFARATPQFAGN